MPAERKPPLKLKENSRVFLHCNSKGCPQSLYFVIYFKLNGGGRNLDVIHVRTRMQCISRKKFYGFVPKSFYGSPVRANESLELCTGPKTCLSKVRDKAIMEGQEIFGAEF